MLDPCATHEELCGVGGLVEARHDSIRDWSKAAVLDAGDCTVEKEVDVSPPLVATEGRMDLMVTRQGVKHMFDVAVSSAARTNSLDMMRRTKELGRSLRTAEQRKAAKHGASVTALAIEDTGRIGPGTVRFLSELAKTQELIPVSQEYRRLLAEMQHVMLLGTAAMLRSACGLTPIT